MKKMITLAVFAMLVCVVGSSFAEINWAGNIWPTDGANVVPTGPVDVYVEVYKGGVTDGPGQGADITVDFALTNDLGGTFNTQMTYLNDVGNNDNYTGQIPQSLLVGAAWVDVQIDVNDLSDGTMYTVFPVRYLVVNTLPNDVDVTFSLCMSGEATTGDPCVIGDAAVIGVWDTGVNMTQINGDLYEVVVTFLAGSNPNFEYKFKKDGCANWESVDNRLVTLPTDGTTAVVLDTQSWDGLPMGCGNETFLTEDKNICFQVCMDGVDFTESVCLTGNLPEFSAWGSGVNMTHLGGSLYQVCIVFPAGTLIPLNAEYKFRKDGCDTWEGVSNRVLVIDNNLDAETTLTHAWDDGPGICNTVATEETNWDSLKAQYR